MQSSLRTIEIEGIAPLRFTITEDGTRIWHFESCHLEIIDDGSDGIEVPRIEVFDAIRQHVRG